MNIDGQIGSLGRFYYLLKDSLFSLAGGLFFLALLFYFLDYISFETLASGIFAKVLWTIIGMYIVGTALYETGDITHFIQNIVGKHKNYSKIIIRLLFPVTFLSGFMNNTPLVATFIPICRHIANDKGFTEKKILLPLSFAAILGGNLTFIGATTHILLNEHIHHLTQAPPFSLVAITPLAIILIGFFYLYLYFCGFDRLPKGEGHLTGDYIIPLRKKQYHYKRNIARYTFLAMAFLIITGLINHVWAAILCAAIVLVTGCVSIRSAISCFNPQLILIILASFPLAQGMINIGLSDMMAEYMLFFLSLPKFWMFFTLYIAVWLLTEIINNIAVSMMLLPVFFSAAQMANIPPEPLLFLLMVAVASSFLTPIGYHTNIMVYIEGGYKARDFFKFGWPIGIMSAILTSLYCWLFF